MKNKKVFSIIVFLIIVFWLAWLAPILFYFFTPEHKISNTIKLLQENTVTNQDISLIEEDIKAFRSILNYINEHELTHTEFNIRSEMVIDDINGEIKEGFLTAVEAFKYEENGKLLENHYGLLFFVTKRVNILFLEVTDMKIIKDIKKQ